MESKQTKTHGVNEKAHLYRTPMRRDKGFAFDINFTVLFQQGGSEHGQRKRKNCQCH